MSVPLPSSELQGHCSAIDDDILYVLSPTGFQSLPLQKNATWSDAANGQLVTGNACAKAVPDGDPSQAALYVIGGTTSDDSYGGLQRYFFANQTWETLSPTANVLQGRTDHSVAYLSDSQSILVYAGSQPNAPSVLSSQTFLISLQPPYNIQSFTSDAAPPVQLPILQPWNSSHAVMVGGTQQGTGVYLFGPSEGWTQYGTNLSHPVDPSARGVIVDGADGSKVLQLYNMNISPNVVSSIVLQDADGQPAATGQLAGANPSSRKRKRDLTLDDWPAYNSTNAPSATRTDCSVAQGPQGLAAVAGGNSATPVVLFDQSQNSWVDAGEFFDDKNQQPLLPSVTSVSVSTASATSSPPASSTAAASGSNESNHDRMLRTLGITLGVLCGIAALFILILLFLRWRKMKQKGKDGYIDEKSGDGGRMSFVDRGASFMKEAGGSINDLNAPRNSRYNSTNGSRSSLAIIAGRFNGKRNTVTDAVKTSFESTARLVKSRDRNTMTSEPMEMMNLPTEKPPPSSQKSLPPASGIVPPAAVYSTHLSEKDARDVRKRSSGWSKYFATSQPTGPNGVSHIPSVYIKPQASETDTSAQLSTPRSTDVASSTASRIPSSALVPPLDIDFSKTIDGQRLSHVTSGSPAFSDSREDLAKGGSAEVGDGQKGHIVGPRHAGTESVSGHSMSSYNRSTMSSTLTSDYYNESGNTPWTPFGNAGRDPRHSRPPSSTYTASIHEARVPSRGHNPGFFPGAGTSYRPASKPKFSASAAPTSDWASPLKPAAAAAAAPAPLKSGPVTNGLTVTRPAAAEARDSTPAGLSVAKPAEARDSTITVFPRGVSSSYYTNRGKENVDAAPAAAPSTTGASTAAPAAAPAAAAASDMSWLNLGLGTSSNRT